MELMHTLRGTSHFTSNFWICRLRGLNSSWPFFLSSVLLTSRRSGEGPAPALVLTFAPAIVVSLLGRRFLSVDGLRGWLSVPDALALVLLAGVLGACTSPFIPPMASTPACCVATELRRCLVVFANVYGSNFHISVGAEKRRNAARRQV